MPFLGYFTFTLDFLVDHRELFVDRLVLEQVNCATSVIQRLALHFVLGFAVHFLLLGGLDSTDSMVELHVRNLGAHALEQLCLVWRLLETGRDSAGCYLIWISVDEIEHIWIEIDFQFILCQALLADAIPKA